MDTEDQTVTGNHMQHIYNMWLTTDTQTFSSSLHTVTLHITVFNIMGGYRAFKAACYLHLCRKVTPQQHTKHCLNVVTTNHTTLCQNADATVQAHTTVNTTMLHT